MFLPRHPARKATIAAVLSGSVLSLAQAVGAQQVERTEAYAQDVEEVVVVASRAARNPGSLATAVTILDRDDIETAGYLALSELLSRQPGITGSRTGGTGAVTSLRIRGEEAYRTLLVVDGIRVSDPSVPQITPQLEHLGSGTARRVEILRGPQGLSWGADAGGVILVETLPEPGKSQALEGSVHAGGGSLDTGYSDIGLQGSGERLSAAFTASHLETSGYNQWQGDTQQEDDGYRNDTWHLGVGMALTESTRVRWSSHRVDALADYDNCFGTMPTNACSARFQQESHRLAMESGMWGVRQSLAVQQTDTARQYQADGLTVFEPEGRLQRVDYTGNTQFRDSVMLVWGADWQKANAGERTQQDTGVFGEVIFSDENGLSLSAGGRIDHLNDTGSQRTWRLGLAKMQPFARGEIKWRAGAGSGFRAPSPFEQEYNLGPFALPPAAGSTLVPEYSEGLEAGVDLSVQGLSAGMTLFHQEVTDAITFDLEGYSGYQQVSGRSLSRGLELELVWNPRPHWTVQANGTWNDTEDPQGRQRLYRPKAWVNAGIRYSSPRTWYVGMNARYAGSRRDAGAGTLPGFTVWDMKLAWRLGDMGQKGEWYLQGENLADRQYREVAGYLPPGRTWRAGLRLGL